MKKTLLTLIATIILVTILGCAIVDTPEGKAFVVNPKVHKQVQGALDGASAAAGGMSTFFPALLPIATALGVGGGVWRKMKKTVTKNRKPLEMLIRTLEHVKETDADTWAKIRTEIKKQHPTLDIKGMIEEIQIELENGKGMA